MGISTGTALLIGAGASAAMSLYQGDQQRHAMNQANDQAKQQAALAAEQQSEAVNKANAKAPDTASIIAQNLLNAKGGQGGTMLTGPTGVDPSQLALGKNTLLGM